MAKKKTSGLSESLIRYLSHELKSPLAKMEMSLDLYEKAFKTDDGRHAQKRAEVYDSLINNIHRLKHNMQNVLDLFSVNYGHIKLRKDDVKLRELVLRALGEVKETAERKDIRLESSISRNIPSVPGDSQKIYNVLLNLLDNAVKFTDKGCVKISVRTLPSQVRVSVSDTGIGLDADSGHTNGPFAPFAERVEKHASPGIGLLLCRDIIERHGGEIRAKSKGRNKGAIFSFTLPV
ncbi:MAG: HAMP domain-containing sensor histidine kinase [Candidatus Brocadiales bacterium]